MKAELTSAKSFTPLTMTITLESQKEVDSLTAIFNASVDNVVRNSIYADRDVIRNMLMALWDKIRGNSTRG